jgi:hypothetical protein
VIGYKHQYLDFPRASVYFSVVFILMRSIGQSKARFKLDKSGKFSLAGF